MRLEEKGICRYFLIGEKELRKKSKSERERSRLERTDWLFVEDMYITYFVERTREEERGGSEKARERESSASQRKRKGRERTFRIILVRAKFQIHL